MQANLKNYKFIKKFVRLASITCVTLAIYGCSSTEENINNENNEQSMTPEQQQLFILEKVESWSAAESDVERVLALEADMQLMINQLASMAELDSDPLGNNPAESTASSDLNDIKTGSNNVKKSSKPSGHYSQKVGIHIAMFKDVESVPQGWKYLKSILPNELVNRRPLLKKVNYDDTDYYSLRVGPFNSVNSAKKTCLNLQQHNYCSVVEYKGFPFSLNPL